MLNANRAALEKAVAAFNDPRRREGYLDLYAPGVVLHGYPRGLSGHEGARAFYLQLWRAFPDVRLTVERVLGSDEELAVRYTLSGMQAHDFYGAPVTGQQTRLEGIAWLRFAAGRVVEVWQASGTLDLLTRLTARAAQAPPRPSASAEAAALRWAERHGEA
ncbi:MAG TPA: ester cyclase [Solirubrobacteraceae bacterium]|nr:ester cyclase [Solirubrobacteraceae bacterium]